jgi:type I site-specific restriction-modification system R (restriction) subunit
MPSQNPAKEFSADALSAAGSTLKEDAIEYGFIGKLQGLKYTYRRDISDRASLENNFREKFEALNRVRLTMQTAQRDSAHPPRAAIPQSPSAARDNLPRLLDEIVTPDVFVASKTLRVINSFSRNNTSLNDPLVNQIRHLDDFADRFLQNCALAKTISRYRVLIVSEQKLMIMRPYQVDAVQHMVKCIDDDNGNGFVWHTTGSGKTLTFFKASTLLKENDSIHKCVFVVDRKDLDNPSVLVHQRVTATGQIQTRGKLLSK